VAATPIDEHHATEPASPYGVSKLALERLVHTMARSAGLGSTVLRFFNTYGPGQALSPYVGAVTIFTHALLRGEAPTIFGDGLQCRDFVHVDDITRGCVLALQSQPAAQGLTLNLGTGVATTVLQVVQAVQAALERPGPVRHAAAVPGELRYSIADIGLARRMLDYAPVHELAHALPPVVRAIAAAARNP
jgi:nucleoside-diphosphate-sugar epimerase